MTLTVLKEVFECGAKRLPNHQNPACNIIIVFEVAMKPFIVHGFTLQTEKYRLNIVLNTARDHSFGRTFEGQA